MSSDGAVSEDPGTLREYRVSEQAFRAALNQRLALAPKKEVTIYLHGYNNSFEDAAFTLAELWHFMGREGVPLLYTWPADRGGIRGYAYDRESGQFTLYHLKQLLRSLARFPEVEKVHIVAHSRGTDVATTTPTRRSVPISPSSFVTGKNQGRNTVAHSIRSARESGPFPTATRKPGNPLPANRPTRDRTGVSLNGAAPGPASSGQRPGHNALPEQGPGH